MNKLSLTLALTLAGALGVPSAASAETFCVNLPSCVGTSVATPQEALDLAALNNATDTVRIGPKATPYPGGLSYVDPERITIVGAGADQTVISVGASTPGIVDGNSTSRVEDLALEYGDDAQLGLRLGAVAEDVRVTGTGADPDTTALRLLDGGSFRSGSVSSPGWGVESFADTGASISDSSVSSFFGIGTHLTGKQLTASRLYIRSTRGGVSAGAGHITIDNSVIRTEAHGFAGGVYVLSGATLVANHLTVVGSGTGKGVEVGTGMSGSPANATLSNTIVTGYPTALSRYGDVPAANLTMRYSAFSGGAVVNNGPGQLDISVGNSGAQPEFANPGGLVPSFRLVGGSALVDAGDPTETLALDKDGLPREVDGDGQGGARADIGAYEYQRRAPEARISLTPAAPAAGEALTLSGALSSDEDHGDRARFEYAWQVDGAPVGTGVQISHVLATPGTHSVSLTVTDPAGLTDTETAQLEVAGGPAQPPQPPTGPGADTTAPRLTGLKAGPRRLAFSVSEPATVMVRLTRRGGKRGRTLRLTARQGRNTVKLARGSLRDGHWRIGVSAVDSAGNSSKVRRLRLRVR